MILAATLHSWHTYNKLIDYHHSIPQSEFGSFNIRNHEIEILFKAIGKLFESNHISFCLDINKLEIKVKKASDLRAFFISCPPSF